MNDIKLPLWLDDRWILLLNYTLNAMYSKIPTLNSDTISGYWGGSRLRRYHRRSYNHIQKTISIIPSNSTLPAIWNIV